MIYGCYNLTKLVDLILRKRSDLNIKIIITPGRLVWLYLIAIFICIFLRCGISLNLIFQCIHAKWESAVIIISSLTDIIFCQESL